MTVLILLSSYQEYMVNTIRNEGDWEARFSNIKYSEALQIEKNENIENISLSYRIGTTDNVSKNDFVQIKFDVRGYNKNALKNAQIYVTEGRLPEKENEVIVSMQTDLNYCLEEKIEVGKKLTLTMNNKTEEYIVVREN